MDNKTRLMWDSAHKKNTGTFAVLALFLGGLGVHRFYLGGDGWWMGFVYLGMTLLSVGLLWPVTGLMALIELILCKSIVAKRNDQEFTKWMLQRELMETAP